MTKEEKFTAIVERLKKDDIKFDPAHLSAMSIIGYLEDLANHKLIESAFTLSPSGKNVAAICEEFEWQPSDKEIIEFVVGMVEEKERPGIAYIIKQYRDDRTGLMEELQKFKDNDKK